MELFVYGDKRRLKPFYKVLFVFQHFKKEMSNFCQIVTSHFFDYLNGHLPKTDPTELVPAVLQLFSLLVFSLERKPLQEEPVSMRRLSKLGRSLDLLRNL